MTETTTMQYWPPQADLAGLVTGYHHYRVSPPPGQVHRDAFQPAWFNLRILLTPETVWRVRIGAAPSVPVPAEALFGPGSKLTWSASDAGAVVGVGLTPLAWLRLNAGAAADLADRVLPAGDVLSGVAELAATLRDAGPDETPALFGHWLSGRLAAPQRGEERAGRIMRALLDPAVRTVSALAAEAGVTPRTLERLCLVAFGFPPKLLLRRARFLRSMHALLDRGSAGVAIDPSYSDYSHFVREAHEFLGMTPTRFQRMAPPMLRRSLEERARQLGAPAQALAKP
ncbi:AraC family transcriptional regulator [Novosphingobium cyanobacteriorum]|uniref:Helix-turn-helix domain-containing protein n=1 Tax=Novosphingobium cyanobacteriorum TaxID=3024215 RepID=A0ABT6CHP1_9SPHN|nr:helix-turn-helix domain-containing protein [Novosphingobium cyanobacteriorum]MDF8332580.1 helix-turn-helix domain-containing protein [Novosphingobium cyanobacteriorum]